MAKVEHINSHWAKLPFDEQALRSTASRFIEGHMHTMLVSDGGYFAGLMQPVAFASNQFLALEYAWFAQDGNGLALLAAFERWAENMGAVAVVVGDHGRGGRLRKALEGRRKYEMVGSVMAKKMEVPVWQ